MKFLNDEHIMQLRNDLSQAKNQITELHNMKNILSKLIESGESVDDEILNVD